MKTGAHSIIMADKIAGTVKKKEICFFNIFVKVAINVNTPIKRHFLSASKDEQYHRNQ